MPDASDREIAAQLDRRRSAAAARWSLTDEVVLVGAGEEIPVPGRGDLTYPFRAHSEYFYLTDRERPGGVLAFDPHSGWVDFVTPVTQEELLWSGVHGAVEAVPDGAVSAGGFPAWMEKRRGRRIGCLGAHIPGVATDGGLEGELRCALNDVRRRKDAVELGRMRDAARATRHGFAEIVRKIEPGLTEREIRIELEAAFFRNGADFLAFGTVVAAGAHAAVLHHAPTDRPLAGGELVLIDAGGESRGYASDVTRTYPVSGSFTGEQAELHSIVRAAGVAAMQRCTAGTEWRDVHRTAALAIAHGLVELGLLRGQPETLLERGSVSLFFPHGIGHMVGLGIRDAGEVLRGRPGREPGFPPLRVDLPLQPGHVFTVEPGIYFVPALLCDPDNRTQHADAVDWQRVDRMLTFGGIRIEDNVLVTDDAPDVLTADIPVPGS